ncbi:MAG: TlpA family protein disulfide reductase [Nitrospinae bacterium]|nr:TlpA family protein disulfide reductase [Nitrospinota bacterium]
MKFYAAFMALLISSALAAPAFAADASAAPAPAPSFDMELAEGGKLSLASLKGKAVILNFWATWCGPCKKEMPALEAAHRKHKGNGVTVVGVNFDQEKGMVNSFLKPLDVTFPNALDAAGKTAEKYGVMGLPTTIFINGKGLIVGQHTGAITADQLEGWIAKMAPGK